MDDQGRHADEAIQASRLADTIAPPLGLRLHAATLIGGGGDDTYYVDQEGDLVVEAAGEGIDTVQSSIDYMLGDEVENLVLLDFAKPEHGQVDGREVLVYGYPKRNELDYMQGDAVADYLGTCALTSIANLRTQSGQVTTESEVVNLVISNDWAVNDPSRPASELGGSNVIDQQAILDSYGIRNSVIEGYNEAGLANLLRSGRGLIVAVKAGMLWEEPAYQGAGGVNHAITLTGAVYAADTGELTGFYIADSGRGKVGDMTRYLDIETFRRAADVPNAYAIYTVLPIKYWDEHIDAIGNARDNTLIGNRGDNLIAGLEGDDLLDGGAGNDLLEGGTGGDVYRFGVGSGRDRIREDDADADAVDIVQLGEGVNAEQLWFEQVGLDLQINLRGTDDSLTVERWFEDMRFRTEQIRTADGGILIDQQVSLLVEAMASFAPPPMATCMLPMPERGNFSPVLVASWG